MNPGKLTVTGSFSMNIFQLFNNNINNECKNNENLYEMIVQTGKYNYANFNCGLKFEDVNPTYFTDFSLCKLNSNIQVQDDLYKVCPVVFEPNVQNFLCGTKNCVGPCEIKNQICVIGDDGPECVERQPNILISYPSTIQIISFFVIILIFFLIIYFIEK